ncbi:MAG: thioredoxin [Promethearchaeota archaeon CR_4]|nr:MAG: thioredoxin [Candidatus Lokiarchaeota archaeon CR_4]
MKNAGPTPVICDFWASWCGPCQRIAPTFEALAGEFDGRVKFAKVNADKALPILQEYAVRSIPTFIVFKNGEEVDRKTGACDKGTLTGFLKECIEGEK